MSSNAPHRLAAAITRTQTSFAVAGAVRYCSLLTPVNLYPQTRTTILRPFTSFPHLRSPLSGLYVDRDNSMLRLWTARVSQSFESKRPINTSNGRRLERPLGQRSLEGPGARGPLNPHQDLRTPLHMHNWPPNGIALQILRSSSTNSRGVERTQSTPLPNKSGAQFEKGTPEFSNLPGSSIANKHIIDRLPSIPHMHKPTKEELLAAATGFWSRLKVRFKWFSIRSVRPFNVDEIGAFFSWVLLGHVLWIILGTTTFFSLAIFAVNTVFAQGTSLSPFLNDQLMAVQKLWHGGLEII